MGFKTLSPEETIRASFTLIEVYKIQGFSLDIPSSPPASSTIRGFSFRERLINAFGGVEMVA
jgi:hypothetical protein